MADFLDAGAPAISRRAFVRGAAGLGLTAAAGGLVLPACGSGGGGETRASRKGDDAPPETTSIRLFSIPPFNCFAAMVTAEPFFREEGFTDIQYPKYAAKEVIPRFANGEIDFGVGYFAVLSPFVDKRLPFVMLGGIHLGCWEVVATGDIKTMRDFKGKTVSIIGPNFTDGVFMAMTLAAAGLDINRDVKVVNYLPNEHAKVLSEGIVDAVVAVPPISDDLRAKGIGHVVLNSITDQPWSNYYCCTATAHRSWMEKHPVAAKRALRAMLKGADVVAKDPEGAARLMVDKGHTTNYDYTCDLYKRMPYNVWREFDNLDSARFYSLRLKEAGLLEGTPEEIIERGTNFDYVAQIRRELKEA